MLLNSVKDNRETFAWVLTGFVAASLLVELVGLFIDEGFVSNAAGGHLQFVSPLLSAALALAVVLVSFGDEPIERARPVLMCVLALVGAMLLLGFVSWLVGLTLETFQQSAVFRTVNSLRFLVDATVVGAAGWFGWLVLESSPAAARPQGQWRPSGWGLQHARSLVASRIERSRTPRTGGSAQSSHEQPRYDPADLGQTHVFEAPTEERHVGLSIFDSSADTEPDMRDNYAIGASTDGDMGTPHGDDVGDQPGMRRRW